MKSFIIAILILILSDFCAAQSEPQSEPLVVAERMLISSEALQQTREIQVYLPKGYSESSKYYPVLYLLDGKNWFLQGVSLVKNFREFDYIPDLIVVGIDTSDDGRRQFFNQSQRLSNFLNEEVITYIDKSYRTSNSRLLFGWQFAGSFALSQIIDSNNKFSGYILASPFPLNGARLTQIKRGSQTLNSTDKFLFFASHPKEASVVDGTDELNKFLLGLRPEALRWQYMQLKMPVTSSIAHRYSPIDTLFHGLLTYYSDYSNLEFDTLEEFQNYGGIEAVEKFYKNKGKKYGVVSEITQEGMFNLVRLAMRSDNLVVFDELLKSFHQHQFLENTNLGWSSRYAEFYLKNNSFEKAIAIYQLLAQRFPNSASPVYGLGKVFEARKEEQEALKYYQLTVDIAQKVPDSNLNTYKEAILRLKMALKDK